MIAHLKTLLLAALAVFAPIKAVLITAMVLVFLDMLLGIGAALKQKVQISSKRLGHTVIKVLVYEIAIVCAFMVQKFLIQDSMPLLNLVGGLVGLVELVSILENIDIISGKTIFVNIIKVLQSKSDKIGQ